MDSSTPQNRKDLKRAYKETEVQAGIWIVRNLKNGKILLGAAENIGSRLSRHRFALETRRHECSDLQLDWDREGGESFSFEMGEVLEKPKDNVFFDIPGELKKMEKVYLEKLKPYGERGYHEGP
jgi:hypothetical protein